MNPGAICIATLKSEPGIRGIITSLTMSPDGALLVVGYFWGKIRIFDVAGEKEIKCIDGANAANHVRYLAFCPNGEMFAGASLNGRCSIWFPANWHEYGISQVPGTIFLAFSSDGRLARATDRGVVFIQDEPISSQHTSLQCPVARVTSLCLSPDFRVLAFCKAGFFGGGKSIQLWAADEKRKIAELEGHTKPVDCLGFSSDGHLLASGSKDSTTRLWNLEDGHEVSVLRGHTAAVKCLAFSPDSRSIATGSDDRTVRLWSIHDGNEVTRLDTPATCLCISPDGRLLAVGGAEGTIGIWSLS